MTINGETWLICGGRDFTDEGVFNSAMSDIMAAFGCPARVIHGAARGADTLAAAWADRIAVDVEAFPADWGTHGRAAGPIRNQQMLGQKPDRVIAFPGGRGTAHMVGIAKKAGVHVVTI